LPTPSASTTLSPINDYVARDLIRIAPLVQWPRAALNDGDSHGRGHTHSVHSVMFGPDGHRLLSASADRTVRILDATPLLE
jgi:WD40 repeat protein